MLKQKITAQQILNLLKLRHSKDVFIPECKTGPSQGIGCPRLDAWAMTRSWANALSVGYEIKVARSDFLQDRKWMDYLLFCNEFYFVCPPNLIGIDEVPKEVGLMYVSMSGTMIRTKKKAVYRTTRMPEEFYRYILMCRSSIHKCEYGIDIHSSKEEFWRDWLKNEGDLEDLGHQVSKRLQQMIHDKINEVNYENNRLVKQIKQLEGVRQIVERLGLNAKSSWLKYNFEDKLKELKEIIPKDLEHSLEQLEKTLASFRDELKKLDEKKSLDKEEN